MGRGGDGALGSSTFAAWVEAIVVLVLLQSLVHLGVVLGAGEQNSVFDLDRSNGIPDVVSTLALAAATAGAAAIGWGETGCRRVPPAVLAVVLAGLTLADLLHEGAHPAARDGAAVVGLAVAAGILLIAVAVESSHRVRVTLAIAAGLLAASFLVSGLDRLEGWFARSRGDLVEECRIVAKEGLELLGWSLVGLALWDEALRRRSGTRSRAQGRG